MKISYSAPGKIILSGEHSVVYGKPAFVSAVDLHLTFSLSESSTQSKIEPEVKIVEKEVVNYLQKNNITFTEKKYSYQVSSEIPRGRGMGSSAAFAVAGVAAFLHFYTGTQTEKSIINQIAYKVEKHFHGNPSGVDNSTSAFGGLIFFRKEFEFLKHVSSLNFKIPQNILEHLYLIDTGKPSESTGKMVELVGKKYNESPKEIDNLLNRIERLTKRMVVSVVKEDPQLFKSAIAENNEILEKLGVVSESAQRLIADLGAYGTGKITGAGGKENGSGFVVFFAEDKNKLQDYLQKNSIQYFKFQPNMDGVKAHQ